MLRAGDSQVQRDQNGREAGPEHQLDRRRRKILDILNDRPLCHGGHSKIAPDGSGYPIYVLHRK